MVPIKQDTVARTAVWGELPTRIQTVVSLDEPAGSLDKTIALGTVPGADTAEAQAGLVLRGRYRLEEILVRRADTETWRAFDVLLVRPVIVHLLSAARPNHALLAAAKRAVVATDFRLLRVLDATIPAQSDVPEDGWAGPYIVCEYAPGKSLTDLLSGGPLSTLEAAWMIREIADALIGMHARGLHHQRLSPDTVVITETGNVKIVGFLLEAEMAPSHQRTRDPQHADVEALGHLLYAMLTSRWPEGHKYGMAAAPTDSEGRLLSPLEVQPSVPPSLNQICDRVLRPSTQESTNRLRTAAEVSAALSRVLGTADAAQDLEQRVRVSEVTGADKTLAQSPAPSAMPAAAQPKRPTRWRRLLVPLVLIAIIGSLTAIGLRLDLFPDAPGSPAAPSEQWQVVAAKDFDPEGNGEEHPNEVTLAWDGNPDTSWTTMNYFEGDIGNKSGVGLVFDLGEVRQISRAELDLDGDGTSLEVRIPAAESVTSAPLGSVDQWRSIGTANRTPAATSLPLDEPVQTRYVLIYLTELPAAGGQFTGGIAEARFWS